MDGTKHSITPHDVGARIGSDAGPIAADVRRSADLSKTFSDNSMIVYYGDRELVSQGFMLALRAMGIETNLPEGGGGPPANCLFEED